MTDSGLFHLHSESECLKLHLRFKPFLANRAYHNGGADNQRKQQVIKAEHDRYNFKPAVNPKSREIAETQFQIINSALEGKNLPLQQYWDLMIKKGEIYREHKGEARRLKEESIAKDCTFTPKLNRKRNQRSRSRVKAYIHRGEESVKQSAEFTDIITVSPRIRHEEDRRMFMPIARETPSNTDIVPQLETPICGARKKHRFQPNENEFIQSNSKQNGKSP